MERFPQLSIFNSKDNSYNDDNYDKKNNDNLVYSIFF